jgi:hypothetical protein
MCEKLRQEFDTVAKETIAYRQRNLPRSRKKLNRQPKQKNRQPQIIYEIFVEFTVSNSAAVSIQRSLEEFVFKFGGAVCILA